jgi:hypothetical protein
MIWNVLQTAQRSAELASGALVSSAAISRDTGRSVIAQIPIIADRTKSATALFGRTNLGGYLEISKGFVGSGAYRPRSAKARVLRVWERGAWQYGPNAS